MAPNPPSKHNFDKTFKGLSLALTKVTEALLFVCQADVNSLAQGSQNDIFQSLSEDEAKVVKSAIAVLVKAQEADESLSIPVERFWVKQAQNAILNCWGLLVGARAAELSGASTPLYSYAHPGALEPIAVEFSDFHDAALSLILQTVPLQVDDEELSHD